MAPEDAASFATRCVMRERERQLGTGFGFGIFLEGQFSGEITLSSIQRGPFQSGSIGYWIDKDKAGMGLVPEAVVMVLQFAFESLRLHRIEVAIIPRNASSRRVAEKLRLRVEGVAQGFLEINGEWEDHVRYAITAEEWSVRRGELLTTWLKRA
jgi:ribosomal-protein-alanine N-acetyltransferase